MNVGDLQLDWLKCFVAVVDNGSLSSAAVDVHRSQSAVSMQIKKLEAALARSLLDRGPRGIQLTVDGQMLLGYARRILAAHAEARAAFDQEKLSGHVRLGVAEDFAAKYLTPALKRFTPKHSGVEIELTCEQSVNLIPLVTSGKLDLALISKDQPKRGTLLFQEPMVWVGSAQFELWHKDPLPIAVYDAQNLARRIALDALARQGRDYKVVYHSSSLTGQIAAVESGLAIAALTLCCTPTHLQILGKEHGLGAMAPAEVTLYRSRSSSGSKAVDHLRKFLLEELRSSPLQ